MRKAKVREILNQFECQESMFSKKNMDIYDKLVQTQNSAKKKRNLSTSLTGQSIDRS